MVSVQYAPVSPPGLGDIALGTPCAKTIQILYSDSKVFGTKIFADPQLFWTQIFWDLFLLKVITPKIL